MLIVTPAPHPIESLTGYILRLTEVNGYPSTAYVLASMHGVWFRGAIGRLDATPLMEIAGVSSRDVERLTLLPENQTRGYIRIFGNDLPTYEVSIRRPRICPLCLAEGSSCEAFWELSQAVACPVHRVMLANRCDCCQRTLSWTRRKVAQCSCGAGLSLSAVSSASQEVSELMAVMRHLLYREHSVAPLPASMGHLAHLNLRQFCKLLWVMGIALHKRKGEVLNAKARSRYLGEIERIASALSNWPHGFRSFLKENYQSEIESSVKLPNFKRMFEWLFVRLSKNSDGGDAAFAFLEEQVRDFGSKYWPRSAMVRDGEDFSSGAAQRWGTLTEAAEIMGLHMATMNKMLKAGQIKARAMAGSSERRYAVDLEWARSQVRTKLPAMSIRAAAKRFGVSIQTAKALCASPVYQATHRPCFPGSLAAEDVEALAQKLHALAIGKASSDSNDAASVDEIFSEFAATSAERASVLARLLEQPELILGRSSTGFGPGRLQVDRRWARTVFADKRPSGAPVSVQEAGARLRCTTAVITELKKAGYLTVHDFGHKSGLCAQSINRFEREYEALGKIAMRAGVTRARAYAQFEGDNIRHVKLKGIQAATVFVHHEDAARCEEMLRALGPSPRSKQS
jgi:hypothetical protein